MGDTIYTDFQSFNTLNDEDKIECDENDLRFDTGPIYSYLNENIKPIYTHVVMCYPFVSQGITNPFFMFGKIGVTLMLYQPEHVIKEKIVDYLERMPNYVKNLMLRIQNRLSERFYVGHNHFDDSVDKFTLETSHLNLNLKNRSKCEVFVPRTSDEFMEIANGCFQFTSFKRPLTNYSPNQYHKGYTIKKFEHSPIINGIGVFFSGYSGITMNKDEFGDYVKSRIIEDFFRDELIDDMKAGLEEIFIPFTDEHFEIKRKRKKKKKSFPRKRTFSDLNSDDEDDGAMSLQKAIQAIRGPRRIQPPVNRFFSMTDRARIRKEDNSYDIFKRMDKIRDARRKRIKNFEEKFIDVEARRKRKKKFKQMFNDVEAKNEDGDDDDNNNEDGDSEEDIYIDVMAEGNSDTSEQIGEGYQMGVITGGNALRRKAKSLPYSTFTPTSSQMPKAFRTRVEDGEIVSRRNVNFQLRDGEGEYLYRDPRRSIFPANTWQFGDPYEYYIPSPIKRNEKLNYTPFSLPNYI